MTTVTEPRPAEPATDRPGAIHAVPVRHPGRWVAIAVIVVLVGMFVHLLVTALSMVVGVLGGIILAVMRLSDNWILSGVSWAFTWFFRSVPRYILLFTMGTLGILFQQGISFGVPFDWKII